MAAKEVGQFLVYSTAAPGASAAIDHCGATSCSCASDTLVARLHAVMVPVAGSAVLLWAAARMARLRLALFNCLLGAHRDRPGRSSRLTRLSRLTCARLGRRRRSRQNQTDKRTAAGQF